jgi:branched-chain amino acid transport system ATP-binding protein
MKLEVRSVNVFYGVIHAVKDVSFEVEDGEIVTLIGANGAGKSTVLQTISGLLRPNSGEVILNGQDITKKEAEQIVKLGLAHVPEGRMVFTQLSVEDNLLMGAFTRNNREEILKDLEKQFDRFPRLRERRNQMAGTLSGGEQQMLAIARALMSRPALLLLDEPSMGLSPILVQEIFQIIKQVNSFGTSILLVEQNAHMALSIADRAVILETGSIHLTGQAKDLLGSEEVKKAYLGG